MKQIYLNDSFFLATLFLQLISFFIKNEAIWLDMIEQRNLTSHVYYEYQIKEILSKVAEYKTAFDELKKTIKKMLN